MQITEGL